MKIIFLDIDGVLNSDIWYKNQKSGTKNSNGLKFHLDPHAIKLLNKIVTQTKSKVVLSSTWRNHYPLKEIERIFQNLGFIGEIISKTPNLVRENENFVRGNEILKWCKENESLINCRFYNFKDYVILDDKNDMLLWQKNNFVQMDRYCGLTPSKASEIIKILK